MIVLHYACGDLHHPCLISFVMQLLCENICVGNLHSFPLPCPPHHYTHLTQFVVFIVCVEFNLAKINIIIMGIKIGMA